MKFVPEVCVSVNLTLCQANTAQRQYVSAWYCAKQMSKIWCKNIQAFLRYSNFRVPIFSFASPCVSRFAYDSLRSFNVIQGHRNWYQPKAHDTSYQSSIVTIRLTSIVSEKERLDGRQSPFSRRFTHPSLVWSPHNGVLMGRKIWVGLFVSNKL